MKRFAAAVQFALVLFAFSSCRQKPSEGKPVVELVAQTIAGKNPSVQAKVKNFNPHQADGEILVFGPAFEVLQLSEYLDTVDIYDNVDGFLFSDGLPDFCGETIASVIASPQTLDDDAGSTRYRTSMVKTTLALMDTLALKRDAVSVGSKAAGKLIVFTSPKVRELAGYDLDSLFRAMEVDSPLVYASDNLEDTAKECYMLLRSRNAFTHKISYPVGKYYIALPDSDGVYTIIDTDERFIQN